MTDAAPTRRVLLTALLDTSPEVAAAAGRAWLDAVDIQLIGYDQARMLPMLYKRLHELGVEQPRLLRGTYRKAWVQNQLRFRAAAEFLERLDAAGVPSLVLKGASLIPAYGGDWGLRDMSDVDALVPLEHLEPALALLDDEGWKGLRGVSAHGVVARFAGRRHSWNFEHVDGHQVDLHWHVFATSRGPGAEAAFWSAAVPLQLGPTTTQRFCDGDLLLHVLEHAGHGEEQSRVQWAVDAVMLLRATADVQATARRTAEQAATHDLLPELRERLAVLADVTTEPRVATVIAAVGAARARRHRVLAEHRRGEVGLLPAASAAAAERLDAGLAASPAVWAAYVVTGRRAWVERLLRRMRGPLTTTVTPAVQTDASGWWDLSDGATVDSLCGPGWSFPEPEQGVWSDGVEARLRIPCRGAQTLEIELQVLPRYGGPSRSVEVRVDGRSVLTVGAPTEPEWPQVVSLPMSSDVNVNVNVNGAGDGDVEVAFVIRDPARPVDLGLNADTRRLGVLVRRVRVR